MRRSREQTACSCIERQVGKHVQLFTIRPDGSGSRQLTHLADSDALNPEWSPDGRRIVFARDFGVGTAKEHLDIETIASDGRKEHAFGLHGLNGEPVWSPDGMKVLWVRAPGFALANADGSGVRLIHVPGDNSSPSFSSDGRRIVFRRSFGDRQRHLQRRRRRHRSEAGGVLQDRHG